MPPSPPEDRTDADPAAAPGVAQRIVGLLVLVIGAGLLAAPWWSSTLAASDRLLVVVLGSVFAAIGAYAGLPSAWSRLRTLALTAFMGAFGAVCTALALAVNHPDGTVSVAGIDGFIASEPMPWWARLVAAFFALVCVVTAALGLWGLLRGLVRGAPPEDAG